MKSTNSFSLVFWILIATVIEISAQIPTGFNYQAVLRNSDGALMKNRIIQTRFTIKDNTGGAVFSDTYHLNTNEFGMFNVMVGHGSSDYQDISWIESPFSLTVEIDSGSGFEQLGSFPILSVPYADLARDVINKNDADADPANELQQLSKSGKYVYLSRGGGEFVDEVNDADADPGNELQTLSFSGSDLTISGGNTVSLPAVSKIADIDNDTKILVEKTPDEDIIHFETKGTEYFRMTNGRLETENNGNSVFIGKGAGQNDDLSDNFNTMIGNNAGNANVSGNNNVAVGSNSLFYNQKKSDLVAIGDSSLFNNGRNAANEDEGISNTAVGAKSLLSNTTGSANTAIGNKSLYSNINGNANTAVGLSTLEYNTIGNFNSAFGFPALQKNTSGNLNTAIGSYALYANSYGSQNTALGAFALFSNETGIDNLSLCPGSLYANISGSKNIAIGTGSLANNISANSNIAIGSKSLYKSKDKSYLIAIGDSTLFNNGEGALEYYHGSQNIAIGSKSLFSNTLGYGNIAIGYQTLHSSNSGNYNTAIGIFSLYLNTSGSENTAIGDESLLNNTIGAKNSAVGSLSLRNNTTGNSNSVLGFQAMNFNTTGHSNVAIGINALKYNKTRSNLVAIGDSALYYNNNWTGVGLISFSTGNTAIGSKSLFSNTKGESNTATGFESLYSNTVGTSNCAFGSQSLYTTIGSENSAFGYKALYRSDFGSQNTAIGASAGYSNGGSRNVFIGYKAGYGETGDAKLYVENSDSKFPLIYGDFNTNKLCVFGNLGIESKDPQTELHIFDGLDADDDAVIRLQSNSANNKGIIEFYENTSAAMSVQYDGTANSLQLIDLTPNPPSVRVTFERSGDVGIGKENPTHLLDVGNSGAYCDGGAWIDGSSRDYKTDIKDLSLSDAESAFSKLQPVRFRYNDDPEEENLGFIAEDVPDLVATKDRKGLSAMDFVAVLTKVVQNQQMEINELQNALSKEQNTNKKIAEKLLEIEKMILEIQK